MLKRELIQLLKKYKKETYFFRPKNIRAALLESFLNQKAIQLLDDNHTLYFQDFAAYVRQQGHDSGQLFNEEYLTGLLKPDISDVKEGKKVQSKSSAILFARFNAKEKNPACGDFIKIPNDVQRYAFFCYLDAKSTVNLAATNHYFYHETKPEDYQRDQQFWQQGLIEIGCSPQIMQFVSQTMTVSDYRKLYLNLLRYLAYNKKTLLLPQLDSFPVLTGYDLLALSCELDALKYLIANYNSTNKQKCNVILQITALGFLEGLNHCAEVNFGLQLSPYNLMAEYDSQLMAAAAFSGNIALFERVIQLREKALESKQYVSTRKHHIAVCFAALGGKTEMLKHIIKNFKASKLLRFAQFIDELGVEAEERSSIEKNDWLWYATQGGRNVTMVKFLIKNYDMSPWKKDKNGLNALNYAALHGDVHTMKYLINECKMNPHALSGETSEAKYSNINALQFARFSQNKEAIAYLLKLKVTAPPSLSDEPEAFIMYHLEADDREDSALMDEKKSAATGSGVNTPDEDCILDANQTTPFSPGTRLG
jgi:hypothetical protein